jgi:hypothetical protein
MDINRRTAIIVGVLYVIGDVAGILSRVLAEPIYDPSYLVKVAASGNQIIVGALLVLTMGLALAMVPVVMYSISKKHSQVLALGYVIFRGGLETFTYIATVISWLLLVRLSQVYAQVGALDASSFQALGTLLRGDEITSVNSIIFPLGALMFYYLLYQSKLIPRWISGWGIIGIIPYLVAPLLGMFGVISSFSAIDVVLRLPIAVQEMVLAVWLILKGFNSSAIPPTRKTDMR